MKTPDPARMHKKSIISQYLMYCLLALGFVFTLFLGAPGFGNLASGLSIIPFLGYWGYRFATYYHQIRKDLVLEDRQKAAIEDKFKVGFYWAAGLGTIASIFWIFALEPLFLINGLLSISPVPMQLPEHSAPEEQNLILRLGLWIPFFSLSWVSMLFNFRTMCELQCQKHAQPINIREAKPIEDTAIDGMTSLAPIPFLITVIAFTFSYFGLLDALAKILDFLGKALGTH